MDFAIGLLFLLACGLLCLRMARRRNRSAAWILAGLTLNLIGVAWVSCLPAIAPKRPASSNPNL